MTKVRLVKCFLAHNGGPGSEMDVRYIPLLEFNLWNFYMRQKYGWTAHIQNVSYWVDEESFQKEMKGYPADRVERVTRVTVEWVAGDHLIIPQERYFPLLGFEMRKEQFLKHYPASKIIRGREMVARRVEELPGYFLRGLEVEPPAEWHLVSAG